MPSVAQLSEIYEHFHTEQKIAPPSTLPIMVTADIKLLYHTHEA